MADSVLVVIPCLNEAETLPALLARQLRESDATVAVADGGSTDRSRAIVESLMKTEPRLRLVDNPARIQSAGINRAVEAHGTDVRWIVRMDAHCEYPPDYVAGLIEVAYARDATSVVVPMVSQGNRCFQIAAATAQNSRLGTGGSPHRHLGEGRFVDHGHHALMDRALFEQVGGYRDDMSHNEDAELDQRLIKAGARIWLEPRLALRYYPRATVGSLWRQYWNYGQGRARTLRLHRQRPKLRQTLPVLVPIAALLPLLAPGQVVLAMPVTAWALGCLLGGTVVGARAGGRCALLSGLPAMIMHMAWGLGFLRGAAFDRIQR